MEYISFFRTLNISIFILNTVSIDTMYLTRISSFLSLDIKKRNYELELLRYFRNFLSNKGYKELKNIEFRQRSKTVIIYEELFNVFTATPNYKSVGCYIYYKDHALKHMLFADQNRGNSSPAPLTFFKENDNLYKYIIGIRNTISLSKRLNIYNCLKIGDQEKLKTSGHKINKREVISDLIKTGKMSPNDVPSFIMQSKLIDSVDLINYICKNNKIYINMNAFNNDINDLPIYANTPMLLSIVLESSTSNSNYYVEPIIYYPKIYDIE
ncbi:hypothetical protein NUSPORA_02610 [Nucleospora cyclopteri]